MGDGKKDEQEGTYYIPHTQGRKGRDGTRTACFGIPHTFAFPCPELVWTGEIQLIGPIQKWQKHMIMVWVRLNRITVS